MSKSKLPLETLASEVELAERSRDSENSSAESKVDYKDLSRSLARILTQLNIKKVIYIDDDFNESLDYSGIATQLLELDRNEFLKAFSAESKIVEAPDDETLRSVLDEHLLMMSSDEERQQELEELLRSLGIGLSNQMKSSVKETLERLIAKQLLHMLSPAEWRKKATNLKKLVGDGSIIVLCDQDLKQAETGVHIIKFLKESEYASNIYCALISDLILSTQKEVTWVHEQKTAGNIPDVNFFALSKERTKQPVLICDGIKKTLLNDHLRDIKSNTESVLREAFESSLKELDLIDTYDFDHAILSASVSEGVWEVETLLRIVKNLLDKQVKRSMVEQSFLKRTNPVIKKAVNLSRVRFKIDGNKEFEPPYDKRYRLRHEELYESSGTLNKLYSPIANGDIFVATFNEIKNGATTRTEKTLILADQECDIIMRATGKRNRKSGFATLLPVTVKSELEIVEDRDKFNRDNGLSNHYLHNKYKLDYFEFRDHSNYSHGIVDFSSPYFLTFDVLDLIPFNSGGSAEYRVGGEMCDSDLLSIAWEKRMKRVGDYFSGQLAKFNQIYEAIGEIEGREILFDKIKDAISISPCINFPSLVCNSVTYQKKENERFDFGLKRVLRLNEINSKHLLHRYNYYMSRFADNHDFARQVKL